jgi:hypothetical protein
MDAFNALVTSASTSELWSMHGAIVEKLKNSTVEPPSSCPSETASTASSSTKKARKLSDLAPQFAAGSISNPEPVYIKTLDNLVYANLIYKDGKCFFQMMNGTVFNNPSAFALFHSNQITPLHPKATKPGDGWHHIKLVKNDKRLASLLETSPANTVVSKKPVSEVQKAAASNRSRIWAEEAHAILVVLRASNPAATYNDAQKELKRRKGLAEETVEPPKYIESVVLKFISRLSNEEKKNGVTLLGEKFGMTAQEAAKYL